jgi:hypothetical protein
LVKLAVVQIRHQNIIYCCSQHQSFSSQIENNFSRVQKIIVLFLPPLLDTFAPRAASEVPELDDDGVGVGGMAK